MESKKNFFSDFDPEFWGTPEKLKLISLTTFALIDLSGM